MSGPDDSNGLDSHSDAGDHMLSWRRSVSCTEPIGSRICHDLMGDAISSPCTWVLDVWLQAIARGSLVLLFLLSYLSLLSLTQPWKKPLCKLVWRWALMKHQSRSSQPRVAFLAVPDYLDVHARDSIAGLRGLQRLTGGFATVCHTNSGAGNWEMINHFS